MNQQAARKLCISLRLRGRDVMAAAAETERIDLIGFLTILFQTRKCPQRFHSLTHYATSWYFSALCACLASVPPVINIATSIFVVSLSSSLLWAAAADGPGQLIVVYYSYHAIADQSI
jgi:hypothetical protein